MKKTAKAIGLVLAIGASAMAQSGAAVTAKVTLQHLAKSSTDSSGVVIWLTPVMGTVTVKPATGPIRLTQKNKAFEPHMLVIPVGTVVEFPNKDPYFHNVFSLYNGRRFDLGLYEAGTSKSQAFPNPGVSFIYCNIHPEMNAVIVAVPTPWYGTSDKTGAVTLADVPAGRYVVHVWYERTSADQLTKLSQEVTIDGQQGLPEIHVIESSLTTSHQNKFGQDYDPVSSYGGRGNK